MVTTLRGGLRVLLFETPSNPYFNLAFDEAVLERVRYGYSDPVLRVWRNDSSVVVGMMSRVGSEVNTSFTKTRGIPVVRRFSGGGAVYHDLGNINYTLVVRKGHDPSGLVGIDYIYGRLLNGVIRALRSLGAANPEVRNTNDVVVGGYKVSGNSGCIRGDTYLLHGTVLVSADLETLYNALIIPPKGLRRSVDPVKWRVANIGYVLGREVGLSSVVNALVEGFSALLGRRHYLDLPSSGELKLAEELYLSKYSKEGWNYRL